MANQEHVDHLLQGVEHWNEWRATRPEGFRPDFLGHRFDNRANFRSAYLEGANFIGAHLQGAKFIETHLEGANFSDADLAGASFGEARLAGATFIEAHLAGANFSAAYLDGADFRFAHLNGANFRYAALEQARFWSAHLGVATFTKADLAGASFGATHLAGADFEGARIDGSDLRLAQNFVLDDSRTRQTQFGRTHWLDWLPRRGWFNLLPIPGRWSLREEIIRRGSVDPWSHLRATYSGPKLLYHLLFLAAFALPLILNAATWKAANRGQQTLAQLQHSVARALSDLNTAAAGARANLREDLAEQWAARALPPAALETALQLSAEALSTAGISTHAELLARINARLGSLQPCLRAHCGPARPMWYVMLGFDRGWRTAAIAVLLLLYNAGRFQITRAVGDMRDNEERTGWCPALSDYGPYYVAHKVMAGILVVAILGALVEIGLFLFTDFVYLPV